MHNVQSKSKSREFLAECFVETTWSAGGIGGGPKGKTKINKKEDWPFLMHGAPARRNDTRVVDLLNVGFLSAEKELRFLFCFFFLCFPFFFSFFYLKEENTMIKWPKGISYLS